MKDPETTPKPAPACTCPSGNGSLRWPCPSHPAPAEGDALAIAKAALEKLAKLGNGERAGNSVGNLIAQEALAALASQVQPKGTGGTATFGALKAVTAECNKLKNALELACGYLTEEQVAKIVAAMPSDMACRVPAGWEIERAGRSITVEPPQPGEPGRLVDPDSREPGDRILYSLCNALLPTGKQSLTVAPSPAPAPTDLARDLEMAASLMDEASKLIDSLDRCTRDGLALFRWPLIDELDGAAGILRDRLASPSPAVQAESDPAEFEVWEGDELFAGTSGPRTQAWAELLRYARQCEGVVRVFEVSRVERTLSYVPVQESQR